MKTVLILLMLVLFFSFLKGLNTNKIQNDGNPEFLFSEIHKKNMESEKLKKLEERVSKVKVSSF